MQTRDTVVAVFHDRDDAQDAINALRDTGFAPDDISVLARDRDQAGALAKETGTEAGTGAATGALAGGLLGGVAGWLVGIGALAIPGIGPIIAAGPIAAALGGAALGAAGGGIIGALTGAGVPEEEARWYDEQFRGGGILITVNARGRYDEALSIMREYGGRDASTGRETTHASWDETAPTYRQNYERTYGGTRAWDDVEPAHRFGYESYGKHGRSGGLMSWSEAEQKLESDWTSSGRGDWGTHRDEVRRGWDYGRGRTRFRDYDRTTKGG
ncbi:MAG: general stress protein, partial [Chloroflexota bacterium]|nr:general stress protein [Chloroflexota bacterium]